MLTCFGIRKGDGNRPICTNCQRKDRQCQWICDVGSPRVSERLISPPALVAEHREEYISTQDPEQALQDPQVAQVFRHYIRDLAGWYDLNDGNRHFKDVIPARARRNPLLLSAILAFSAANLSHTAPNFESHNFAEFYHLDCVQRLISVTKNLDSLSNEETLAAICLLRSYEIISQDFGSQNHLQGCYSLVVNHHIELSTDLFSAGFWNYLREDITVSLIKQRDLMIDLSTWSLPQTPSNDSDFANYITFLLGKVINRCLREDLSSMDLFEWNVLKSQVQKWRESLPPSFEPIRTPGLKKQSRFSSVWTLGDWHASSLHYYHTAMSILWLAEPTAKPSNILQRVEDYRVLHHRLKYHATEACSLALSSDSAPVWVNAFGPIAFCGPWLRDHGMSAEVIIELKIWGGKTVGLPESECLFYGSELSVANVVYVYAYQHNSLLRL
ncbi:conserved hypothetical protein [Talaromyces stipitatus ATCC 10500]|uniref:Zn(2)-C6 fungal-type domain-containing protein n=1 Tax=Talaromyces stipitatus (strain ATCC 10500 / CBS 375.48 / QM 6759 / NRRL 1006) TaxID=441959 RepID=B8LZU9_TALSN|nr:uncharacterized protein TSTA_081140 [Talaromyces stipitatus ATCC 10500]EED20881.1 conserved hypothetical protein [Talaromyces stipitatus ATCC 10500]